MIATQDNIIDTKTLDQALNFIDKANWSYGWASNKNMPYGHWNTDFTQTTKHNPTDVTNRVPKEILPIWEVVNNTFFRNKAKLTRCYANKHTFGTEGFIHTDSERAQDQTCVVYLNKDWDVNWGGETVFYNHDMTEITKSVIPAYGRTVVFQGNIPHCAKPISRICSKDRTTLMFKVTIDPKAVYESEELLIAFLNEVGAHKLPHKRGSLADHLLRTYHIMKGVGAGDILALAGGLHSLYGTNVFKREVLDRTKHPLASRFGVEVDRLVSLFASIDRPNCLETPNGSLDDLDLFLLRSIECANLHDQGELDAKVYPNLVNFAKQFTANKG